LKLYEYFRSSASYRTRIALNLKGLGYDLAQIHLLKDEQFSPEYRAINVQSRVPTLVRDDGVALMQSPAILEWLDGLSGAGVFAGRCVAAGPDTGDGGTDRVRHPSAE
jgi:glutathione S-transferase